MEYGGAGGLEIKIGKSRAALGANSLRHAKADSMNEHVPLRALALLLMLLPAGCGSAMGQVATDTRGGADKGGLASALDAPLAVGGEARPALHFELRGSAAPSTHLLSARPEVIEVRDGLLVGRAPGVSAVLVTLDDHTVVDFIHLWVKPADRLVVHGIDAAGADMGPLTEAIELLPGEFLHLVPHPYGGPERLVGVGTSTWIVDPPIAVVLREGLPNRVRLVARTPGDADVKVTMLGATSHLKLKVVQ
jgi:hypothetical protein